MHLLTKSTNWIQEFLYRTPRLVPCGTNWKQEFCYRGPPRAKWHSVSERRIPPPLASHLFFYKLTAKNDKIYPGEDFNKFLVHILK